MLSQSRAAYISVPNIQLKSQMDQINGEKGKPFPAALVKVGADAQVTSARPQSFSRLSLEVSILSFLAVSVSPSTVRVIKISCLRKHRQIADGGRQIPER